MSASFMTLPRLSHILPLASFLPQQPHVSSIQICAPTICGALCFAAPLPLPYDQPLTTGLHWRPLLQACPRLDILDYPGRSNAGCAPSAMRQLDAHKLPTPAFLQRRPRIRCLRSSSKSPRCERRSMRTASLPRLPSTSAHELPPPHPDLRPSSSRTPAYAFPWNTATTRSAPAPPLRVCLHLPTPDPWDRTARFNHSGIRTAYYDAGPLAAARRGARPNRQPIAAASSGAQRPRPPSLTASSPRSERALRVQHAPARPPAAPASLLGLGRPVIGTSSDLAATPLPGQHRQATEPGVLPRPQPLPDAMKAGPKRPCALTTSPRPRPHHRPNPPPTPPAIRSGRRSPRSYVRRKPSGRVSTPTSPRASSNALARPHSRSPRRRRTSPKSTRSGRPSSTRSPAGSRPATN